MTSMISTFTKGNCISLPQLPLQKKHSKQTRRSLSFHRPSFCFSSRKFHGNHFDSTSEKRWHASSPGEKANQAPSLNHRVKSAGMFICVPAYRLVELGFFLKTPRKSEAKCTCKHLLIAMHQKKRWGLPI